ncbi:MAG: PAS domain S-box protein [Archaeoglobaceae archaeon]
MHERKKVFEESIASLLDSNQISAGKNTLNSAEDRFKDIISCSLDIIWEVDENWRYTYVSSRVEEVLGYTPQEVIGKRPFDFMPPEEKEKIRDIVTRDFLHKQPIRDLKNWNTTKSGKKVCLLTNAIPILDEQGRLRGYRGVDRDITEREEIEDRLKISEKHSRLIAESLPIGIFETDEDGRIIYTNTKWQEIFGIPLEESVDMTIADMFYDDGEEILSEWSQKMNSYREFLKECYIKHPSGEKIWAYVRSVALISDDEVRYLGTVEDITELKESEERYASIINDAIDSLPSGIFILDKNLKVVWVNKVIENFFGIPRDELIGFNKEKLIKNKIKHLFENPDSYERATLNAYRIGDYVENYECHVLPSGRRKERYLLHWSNPIRSGSYKGGRIEHYYDITEQKRAEEVLKKQSRELEQENEQLHKKVNKLMERVEQSKRTVDPESRKESEEGLEDSGSIFLLPVEDTDKARDLFAQKIEAGVPALAVARTSPKQLQKSLGHNVETVWLTTNKVEELFCIEPTDVVTLSVVISEFFKRAPEGVILFEGVEYLLSNVEFSRVLKLIQILADRVSMAEGAIYLVLDTETLGKRQMKQIERECQPYSDINKEQMNEKR